MLGVTLLVFPAVFLFSVLQDRSSTNGGVTSPKSGSGIITIPERNAEYFDHIAFGHGSSVVTVAKTGEVHQWALSGGGRQILPTIATSSALRAVALADGGSRVATLFREPDTTLVSVTETVGSPVENFFSPPGNISDLALCSSPRVTVTFDENHQVRIWNDKQGLPIGSPIATTGGSWFLDQASCTLAVVVPGPLIQVWDLPRGTLSFQVSPTQQVRDLTLSAAGLQVSALETGGEAGFPAKVETWTAADPAVPSNSIPVVNRPTLLTGNSQDTLFAISTGTTLELWDPVTGKLVMSLPEPPADARPLVELRFSPDDRTLVGRSASGQLVLWDLAQLMRTPSRSA